MEGWQLTTEVLDSWEHDPAIHVDREPPDEPYFDVLIARYEAYKDDERRIVTSDEFWMLNPPDKYLESGPSWLIDDSVPIAPLVERRCVVRRPGGRATRDAVLAGFKGGKSDQLGQYSAPVLICPGARVDLIGMTYDTAEPEFHYIADALFSESGFNLPLDKPDHPGIYKIRLTNPRPGVMPEIVLSNGAHLRVVSYENRDNLTGKERDLYIFAEWYQFPGFVAYSDISQNLTARKGEAIFATTPDAAHIETLIELGHDEEATNWHVTPNVPRSKNPYSFSFAQLEEDRKTMTREKFKIGQLGIIGEYIGSCFNYKRGERVFTPRNNPDLWRNPQGRANRDNLKLPPDAIIIGGADTGQHYGSVVAAFIPKDDLYQLYVLDELANYRYVATEIEKSPTYTTSLWYREMREMSLRYGGDASFYCDPNAQFKHDAHVSSGIALLPDHVGAKPEARTEFLREYFQTNRIWFAPWLDLVPYECEIARFPPAGTSTGIWKRISEKDHVLDPLEHIAAAMRGMKVSTKRKPVGKTWIESHLGIDPYQRGPKDRYSL